MGPLGRLVVIKRTGNDGTHFPLCRDTCSFGRGIDCDIRIQLPVVSQQHCRIDIQQQEALLINFSTSNPTQLNGAPINEPVKLKHGDIITIIDRSFRFERGRLSEGSSSSGTPEQHGTEELQRQDAAGSENFSSEKKRGSATGAEGPPRSSETVEHHQRVLTRVLSQLDSRTSNVSPRKRQMSLGSAGARVSPAGIIDDWVSGISENKNEEMSFKRRRVSFGGRLRPELFDENLPPNTPLKRGEAPGKRKSLGTPAPTVLKKIMKLRQEQSPAPEKGEASAEILGEAESMPTSKSSKPHQPDTPRRKSSKGTSRRKSVDKNTLQIVYPKRRSSSSRRKVSGGKSWADVVKLGTKKQEVKSVQQGPHKPKSKKRKRNRTPQKPLDHAENPFSTGHANSPCTIIIGRAHIDKVSVPAPPYRILNNFISYRKQMYTEDFSGLTEMFQTPGKEKAQRTTTSPGSIRCSKTVSEDAKLGKISKTWDVPDKTPLAIKQAIELEDVSQKSSKHKSEPGETLVSLEKWPKAPNVSSELMEGLEGMKDGMPTPNSARKSRSGEEVHRDIQSTVKRTPKSGEMPRMSPRLWRDPSAHPELVEDLTSVKDQMSAMGSVSANVHRNIQNISKHTPESRETPRMSPRLLRSISASPELVEDTSEMNDQISTPKSLEESINEAVYQEIQKTPECIPESGEIPRMSPRLCKDPGASTDLSGMKGHMLTPELPGQSVIDEVHLGIRKTPKRSSMSGETPRMSLRLLSNPSASPEIGEDLSRVKDHMPTPKSPEESSDDVIKMAQRTPKHTPKPEETPRMSLRQLRNVGVSPEVMEDLSGTNEHVSIPESAEQSASDEVHIDIQRTPKHTPKSGRMPRMSLRLLRDPSASPKFVEDLSRVNGPMPTPKSLQQSKSDEEVHLDNQNTPKHTPKSGQMSRMSLRLLRNPSASPEFAEDQSRMKQMPTLKSLKESSNDTRMDQRTPKCTPKSEETPRMSLRQLRNLGVSPEVVEVLSGMEDHITAVESPGRSITNEEVQLGFQKTPKRTPKSGQTPRMSLGLLRDSSAGPEFGEDLSRIEDHMQTPKSPEKASDDVFGMVQRTPKQTLKPEDTPRMSLRQLRNLGVSPQSPGQSISDEEVHLDTRKTPKRTPKSDQKSRMSLKLLRHLGTSSELVEDLSGLKDHMPPPESPEESSDDVRMIQKTPKCTPESRETPRMSLRLQRNPSGSPELMEVLPGIKDHITTVESPGQVVSDEKVHLDIQATPKCTPKSGQVSRMSSRLLRNPTASPELPEDLSRMENHIPTTKSPKESSRDIRMDQRTPKRTPKSEETSTMSLRQLRNLGVSPQSPGQSISDEEVHLDTRKTPKCTPKSSRLLRNPNASPELAEDLPRMDNHMPTPKSPKESSGDARMDQRTPKRTPKSEETPRMSLRQLRNLGVSPEVVEVLSGMEDHITAVESPGRSITNEEVQLGFQKTPKRTPKSGQTSRMSLTLLRNPSAGPEFGKDLSRIEDHMPTPKSPEKASDDAIGMAQRTPKQTPNLEETPRMSLRQLRNLGVSPQSPAQPISDEEVHLDTQKTPKHTPKSGKTPRMSLTLLRHRAISPELVEGPSQMNSSGLTLESPGESSGDVIKMVQRTPESTPESGISPRLLRNSSTRPEAKKTQSGMKDHVTTMESPGWAVSDKEIQVDIQKIPKCTPKSGQMSRMSLRLSRNLSASPEVAEDLSRMDNHMLTLNSPKESSSDTRMDQRTPKCTPKSEETPRMSLRQLRNLGVSPEVTEGLSGMEDPITTAELAGRSISDEVHPDVWKTPESGETSRMSLRLLRKPSASPEVMEDHCGMKGHMPTLELLDQSTGDDTRVVQRSPKVTPKSEVSRMSMKPLRNHSASLELVTDLSRMEDHMSSLESPRQSRSDEEIYREAQKIPKRTPKSGETPRMSPRLCQNPSASPERVEDLAGMKGHTPTWKKPDEPTKQKPEALESPTDRPLRKPSLKIKLEPKQALTLTLLNTPPQVEHPDLQAVNSKLSTDPKERPAPRVGVNKHLRNSTKKTTDLEELTGFQTRGRTRKHPYERAGDGNLRKTPHVYPEEEGSQVAMFPTVNDSASLRTPQKIRESRLPERLVKKEGPVQNTGLRKPVEVATAVCEEETSDSATKNKGEPGDIPKTSCHPGEDESQTNASEKLGQTTLRDRGRNQRTRNNLRTKKGGELQESKHSPHQSKRDEREEDIKTVESNPQAKLRQGTSLRSKGRCKTGPEAQGPQLLPSTETVHVSRGRKKILRSSQKTPSADEALKEETVASRSRGRSRRDVRLPDTQSQPGFPEGLPTEEHEQPVKSLQEKSKPTGEAKKVLRSRRKLNTHSDLVILSAETSCMKTESCVTRSAAITPMETESQVTRSAEAFPTKTEPRVTRSAEACPAKREPRVTRSAKAFPTETKPRVTRSREVVHVDPEESRVTRSAGAFPTKTEPRVTRSAEACPAKREPRVTRSAEAFPTETKPRVTRSREGCPAKTEPRVTRSREVVPVDPEESRVTRSAGAFPAKTEPRVTRSAEAFPVETGESHDPSGTAARVAVKRDEEEAETGTHPADKVSAKRIATRGLRSRRGPSALDIPSPPDTCKTAESGEARRTRGVRRPEPAKEVAQEQESSVEVKTRQRGKRFGKEAQPAPSLPTIQEETGYTDKDDDADRSIPTQDGQGLRSRRRKKVSTEPEGHMSVTSPAETKPPEKPAAKSRRQKEAVASAALPCVRSGRRNKASVSTAGAQECDPEPSVERALSGKRADDPAPDKVTEDKVTGLGTRSSKLRSRNQTEPEPTKKPSCSQSDIKSLPRVTTRGSKRAISEETATQDPKQDKNFIATKRMRTRRYQDNEVA